MFVLPKPGPLARRLLLCAVLGAPIVPLMAWSDEGSQISIDNFKFAPTPLTIEKGTEVTWTNHDDIPHTVRAVDGSFHSKAMDTDDSYAFTFAKPGVYSYFCSLHPKMVGKVVVK